ncbi:mitochondrial PPR repeat protein Ppr5 [Schizosaccharomyces pombe]|uniref:Pentatricopeptide repeat-containing protein 5, mitochondrial n=1 Tax=Schizosaccharomyces pombe (strain 972 / ATCC 24843) TaxID=284812 RepID=PPR5_SCHPO|nr:PPR repeat-containing protein Ppr5 [Schizosaccharomyces pombe]Q10451.2 RecName: Full=Pentatricopeptide repeat-containing protein 5, mitochondrial; Flags: Precursor [Schizosaccharomyces pombe 972h-]CAA94707.2 mitochondrial PPR repeat protein Ppr5 [Schizosaccharomyces pombe]|eukprot:NP_594649.2 PPR repeat-containing protein Ppr5 [Schizosaccharomyces pombe]
MVYTKAWFLQNIARQTLGKNVAVHRPPLKLGNMTNWIQQQQAQTNLSLSNTKAPGSLDERLFLTEDDIIFHDRSIQLGYFDPSLSERKQSPPGKSLHRFVDNLNPNSSHFSASLLPASLSSLCDSTCGDVDDEQQFNSLATSPLSTETQSEVSDPLLDTLTPNSLESSFASISLNSFTSANEFIQFLKRLASSKLSIHTFDLYKLVRNSPELLTLEAYNIVLQCMSTDDYFLSSSKNIQKIIKVYVDMLNSFISPNVTTFETVIFALCRRAKFVHQKIESLSKRTIYAHPSIAKEIQPELLDLQSEMPLQTAVFMFTSSLINHDLIYSPQFYAILIESVSLYGTQSQLDSLLECVPLGTIEANGHPDLLPALIRALGRAKRLNSCFQLLERYNLSDPTSDTSMTNVRSWEGLMEAYFDTDHHVEASALMKSFFRKADSNQVIPSSILDCFLRRLAQLGHYKESAEWLGMAIEKISTYKASPSTLSSILEAACLNNNDKFAIAFVRKYTLSRFSDCHAVLLRYLDLLARSGNVDLLHLHAYPVICSVSSHTNFTFSNVYKAFIENGKIDVALRLLRKHIDPKVSLGNNTAPSSNSVALQLSILNGFWEVLTEELQKDVHVLLSLVSTLENQVNFPQVDFTTPLLRHITGYLVSRRLEPELISPRVFGFLLEYAAFNVVQTEGTFTSKVILTDLLKCYSNGTYKASFKNVHVVLRSFTYLKEDEMLVASVRDDIVSEAVVGFSTDNNGQKILADISQVCYCLDDLECIDQSINSLVSKMLTSASPEQVDVNILFFQFGKLIETNKFLHPEVYPTLISVLSKNKRFDAVQRVFEHSKHLYRKISTKSLEKANWFMALILDAMILSSSFARQFKSSNLFCDNMKMLGYIPRASTFAHLINNSTRRGDTDDATTALNIFEETKRHNVKPSVFLYNAVLSKLGRARRTTECWKLFQEMKESGLLPTSVTYGTVINAACRIGDESLAEKLFAEMENQPNYQPRVAPYNTMIQFEVQTMFNREKALFYYNRLCATDIEPSSHTYKLLMDAYGTLKPVNVGSVKAVLELMERTDVPILSMHYAAYIHILGNVVSDVQAATSCYMNALAKHDAGEIQLDANLFQSQIESLIANDRIVEGIQIVSDMKRYNVSLNAYIVNALIKGFTKVGMISKARYYFDLLECEGMSGKEPSTYENMVRAYLSVNDGRKAMEIVEQLKRKRYPLPVVNRISSLVNSHMGQKPKRRSLNTSHSSLASLGNASTQHSINSSIN